MKSIPINGRNIVGTTGVCAASALNSPLKPRKMGNNQTPSECKHLKYDMCLHLKHSNNPWRCPIMDLEDKHCPDYDPKEKK